MGETIAEVTFKDKPTARVLDQIDLGVVMTSAAGMRECADMLEAEYGHGSNVYLEHWLLQLDNGVRCISFKLPDENDITPRKVALAMAEKKIPLKEFGNFGRFVWGAWFGGKTLDREERDDGR